MHKDVKERVVAELVERLRTTQTLIVTDYRGMTMKEIDDLRTRLLEHGARYQVVKNTLTRRAAEAAGADALLALLEGPSAIAFIQSEGDPVAVAKALADAARTTRILAVRGGLLDGRPIGEEDVRNLATVPPREVLQSQLVGALQGPLAMVVGLFAAPLRDVVSILDQRIEQLGGADAAAPAEAPAAEAAPEPASEPAAEEAPEATVAPEEGAATEEPATEEPATEPEGEES
jgi:large subunit ribosomal protein L10